LSLAARGPLPIISLVRAAHEPPYALQKQLWPWAEELPAAAAAAADLPTQVSPRYRAKPVSMFTATEAEN